MQGLTHVSTGAGVCAARSVLRAGPGARPARPARAQPPQGPRGHQVRSTVLMLREIVRVQLKLDEQKPVLQVLF